MTPTGALIVGLLLVIGRLAWENRKLRHAVEAWRGAFGTTTESAGAMVRYMKSRSDEMDKQALADAARMGLYPKPPPRSP
jgi:hypothetical protein